MTFRRHTTFALLLPLVPAYLVACAADPGDAPKTGNAVGTTSPSVTTSAPSSSSSTASIGYGSSIVSSSTSQSVIVTHSSTSVAMTSSRSSSTTSGSSSSSSSDGGTTVVGTGCAAGAKVITLTLSGFNGQSGGFATTGATCVQLMGSVHMAYGVSNCQGRMLTVTGATTTGPTTLVGNDTVSGAISPGADGFVYFNFTAGTNDFASMYVY